MNGLIITRRGDIALLYVFPALTKAGVQRKSFALDIGVPGP